MFAIISKERISLFEIDENFDCIHEESLSYDNVVKFRWSPEGDYSIVISRKGHKFELLDSNFDVLYSKKNLMPFLSGYVDVTWASDSSFFILYTKSSIYLYNTLNLSFKSWSDFRGNINNVIVSDNNYVLIFTDDESNPMFVIYNIEKDFYNFSNYDNFNNIAGYSLHENYQVSYRNFCFFYSDGKRIIKSRINLNNDRLVLLYEDIESSKHELKLFALEISKSIHDIQVNPICTFNNFKNIEIKDFELYFNFYHKEDVLLILWDDQYISKTYLNAPGIKIN